MIRRRLTPRQVRQRKEELKEKNGDKCAVGKRCKHISGKDYRIKTGEELLLDHKNNDPLDNRPDNHQLACRPCNAAKNPRGRTRFDSHISLKNNTKYIKRERERGREGGRDLERLEGRALTFEQRRNLEGERKFADWINDKVLRHGSWNLADIISAGALVANVSIQTTDRWLKKHISSEGLFSTHTTPEGEIVLIFKGKVPTKPKEDL